jgi:hypothetical protein
VDQDGLKPFPTNQNESQVKASIIMRIPIIVTALAGICACQAFAHEKDLLAEIKAWQRGSPPPLRLLKFPDGQLPVPMCGVGVWGDSVADYIAKIENPDLLAAIIFDTRAQPDSFRASVGQFVRIKGVAALARLVTDKRKSASSTFSNHPELAILSQLLTSPYMAIKVAHISKDDMDLHKARSVLDQMKSELVAGKPWAATYGKFAGLNPNMRERAKNPSSVSTLICYRYDGIVSPTGFDISIYGIGAYLPPLEHLRQLFQAKRGTHIIGSKDGVFLYHIESYAEGVRD